MDKKIFTLEEANDMIPRIRPVLENALEINEMIKSANMDITLLEDIWGEKIRQPSSQDNRLYTRKIELIKEKSRELEALIEKINEAGGIVKDLNMGLVDFYHEKAGELVLLCWKRGEDRITHWHTIGGGYSGRRPIEEIGVKTK